MVFLGVTDFFFRFLDLSNTFARSRENISTSGDRRTHVPTLVYYIYAFSNDYLHFYRKSCQIYVIVL
jgi:hypothetical protein